MRRPADRRARRAYRVLLRAYPREHRERYGTDMEDAFLRLLDRDVARAGLLGAIRCWVGAAVDGAIGGLSARVVNTVNGMRRGEVMGTLLSDLRFALRSLGRRPVFAATAILTITLGIGVNAAVFTVVNGFMWAPLPYESPERMVTLWAENPERGWTRTDVNPADVWDYRARARTLADAALVNEDGWNWTGGDRPEVVRGVRVTPNYLSLVGRAPALGRDFEPEEVGEGRDRVAILTDGFWERRFARDPAVLGQTLTLDGEAVVVVGVMPPDFLYHDDRPDLLRPWAEHPTTAERGGHYAEALARLADGATIETARAELAELARELAAEHPVNEGWSVSVADFHSDIRGEVASQASVVLMGAVGFILLMACVNVANLLLARGGGRTRELAVRAALGAGRLRVVRQLLTESLVLAVAGGALGLVVAQWGSRAIVAEFPSNVPPIFEFGMDRNVFLFTAAITLGAAMLFGVLPALSTSRSSTQALRDGGRGGRTRRSSRFGTALVVLQTAMAVVLLVGGGLLMKSISGMRNQDFGFDPTNVLTARIALPELEYGSREASEAYWHDVTDRVRALPGVVAAGTTQSHPLMGSNWGQSVRIAGDEEEDRVRTVRLTLASPGLFEALGFRLQEGRPFGESDAADAPPVAIVNQTFVARYLGPEDDPLSTTIVAGESWSAPIVGVVHDVVERGVEDPPEPALYLPIEQHDVRTRSVVLRSVGDPTEQVRALEEAVWSVDADLPISQVETMDTLVERRIGGFAIISYLMGVFALLSLLLGAVGIYGVTAYATGQRTGEIGVRLAMGAKRDDVVRMVVREGAARAIVGLVIGLALALAMGGAIAGILVGVSPRDPAILGGVALTLAAVSLLGLWVPARRAARVDPVRALGAE